MSKDDKQPPHEQRFIEDFRRLSPSDQAAMVLVAQVIAATPGAGHTQASVNALMVAARQIH